MVRWNLKEEYGQFFESLYFSESYLMAIFFDYKAPSYRFAGVQGLRFRSGFFMGATYPLR